MYQRFSLLAVTLCLLTVNPAYCADFYISPQGDDDGPGTLQKPFRTLQCAREAVRKLKSDCSGKIPNGGVTVWLRGGRYELSEPFILGPQDSGAKSSPAVYRAYADEQPVISGGRAIRGWKKLAIDVPCLPTTAKGKVWVADVPEATGGKWPFRQLWANGKRLTRARWPNDTETAFQVPDALPPPPAAIKPGPARNRWREDLKHAWRTAQFKHEDLKDFPGGKLPGDLGGRIGELFAVNGGQWATMRIPIEKAEGTRVTTAEPMGCLAFYWKTMHRLMAAPNPWRKPSGPVGHVENALSLLDKPGEWFLDAQAGRVYYFPIDGKDPNSQEIVAAKLQRLVCLDGSADTPVEFVELRGLRIEYAEWPMPGFGYRPMLGCYHGTQLTPLIAHPSVGDVPVKPGSIRAKDGHPEFCLPAAVELTYARNCKIELCRIAHVGASGIGLAEGWRRNSIVGCEVADAGGHGIHVGMVHGPICGEDFAWKRPQDEPRANEVSNCYIHDNGKSDWGAYGIISSYSQDTRIAHNLVERQPYSGIVACMTWFAFPSGRNYKFTIEANHIRHVMQKLHDGGGIYVKDGVASSSTICGNLMHNIGDNKALENNAIFLDDNSYGCRLENNMIKDVKVPVRFNRTSHDKFTWGRNYFAAPDVPPNWPAIRTALPSTPPQIGKDYPPGLAERAGPEQQYRVYLLGSKRQSSQAATSKKE